MREVSGPIIAIALVLCAVFVPIAFISGLTGQFYKQFALTIAISTIISAFNSLTLSPALSALLLKSHAVHGKDRLSRFLEAIFGGLFTGIRFIGIAVLVYVGGKIIGLILMKIFAQPMQPPPQFIIYWFIGTTIIAGIFLAIALLCAIRAWITRSHQGFDTFN